MQATQATSDASWKAENLRQLQHMARDKGRQDHGGTPAFPRRQQPVGKQGQGTKPHETCIPRHPHQPHNNTKPPKPTQRNKVGDKPDILRPQKPTRAAPAGTRREARDKAKEDVFQGTTPAMQGRQGGRQSEQVEDKPKILQTLHMPTGNRQAQRPNEVLHPRHATLSKRVQIKVNKLSVGNKIFGTSLPSQNLRPLGRTRRARRSLGASSAAPST